MEPSRNPTWNPKWNPKENLKKATWTFGNRKWIPLYKWNPKEIPKETLNETLYKWNPNGPDETLKKPTWTFEVPKCSKYDAIERLECQHVANPRQNGRHTWPNVANTMQNSTWPCHNVANTMRQVLVPFFQIQGKWYQERKPKKKQNCWIHIKQKLFCTRNI